MSTPHKGVHSPSDLSEELSRLNSSSGTTNTPSTLGTSSGSQGSISQPSSVKSESDKGENEAEEDDSDASIQGLTPGQISVLAQKIYDLWLDEMRIEQERNGRGSGQFNL